MTINEQMTLYSIMTHLEKMAKIKAGNCSSMQTITRLDYIATQVYAGLATSLEYTSVSHMSSDAVRMAQALIAELDTVQGEATK